MNEKKNTKLYLSETNKKIGGVFGGIAEAYDIDVTLLRLIWVAVTFLTGIVPGVLAYIVAWAIMPKRNQR